MDFMMNEWNKSSKILSNFLVQTMKSGTLPSYPHPSLNGSVLDLSANTYIYCSVWLISIIQYFSLYIRLSTRYCLNQLHERDENLKKIYQSVRENAMRNGMEKQQELFRKQYLEKNSSKVGEELRKSHD